MNLEEQVVTQKHIKLYFNIFRQVLTILSGEEILSSTKILNLKMNMNLVEQSPHGNIWKQTIYVLKRLMSSISIKEIDSILSEPLKTIDELETEFLSTLQKQETKEQAVNYTENSILKFFETFDEKIVIKKVIDPFGGTGRLLETVASKFNRNNIVLYLYEYYFLAALIGYLRLLRLYHQKGWDIKQISVNSGDTFSLINSSDSELKQKDFDLIVMNPPFTRTHNLSESIKTTIDAIFVDYQDLLKGQPGLHIYSLILSDWLLKQNGQILAVLPLSTFQSNYSKGIQKMVLNRYEIRNMIISKSKISFSDNSDFREILTTLFKKRHDSRSEVHFKVHDNLNLIDPFLTHNVIPQDNLRHEWNWSIFFKPKSFFELKFELSKRGLKTGKKVGINVLRGVEMYGPDFFCIPNPKWVVKNQTHQFIELENDSMVISMKSSIMIKALRKPGFYKDTISPQVNDYVLSIPPTMDESDLYDYISKYDTKILNSAKNKFGETWINHINHQLETKQPYGHLFFVDKLAIANSGVICHFTQEKIACTKNFYVIKLDEIAKNKIFAAWMNSTLFLILYLLHRREIGSSYGRMQIIDLKQSLVFIDLQNFDDEIIHDILEEFDKLCKIRMPIFPSQIENHIKRKLDLLFLKGLGLTESKSNKLIDKLYTDLIEFLNSMI